MKTRHLAFALGVLFGASLLAPSIASAAPHHRKPHKVCKIDRHHHRVCHWVR
ncbi:MAG: HHHH-motif protein [Bordetella sp.]|nr:HHHH-motif protein [Bordetella sp.]